MAAIIERPVLLRQELDAFHKLADADSVASGYKIILKCLNDLSDEELLACYTLIETTSAAAYKASSKGWSPRAKQEEMKDPTMRYILVLSNNSVAGFLSYMLTVEDDIKVVYCYELHLAESARNKGIGQVLMSCMEAIGRVCDMEQAMLTVFTSNVLAQKFYRKLGYIKYDEEPVQRKSLRSGTKKTTPTYVILAKDLQ